MAHHRDHAHALGASANHQVGVAHADAVGGQGHRLHARRAETVDRHRCRADRQARHQRGDARDVHALLGLGHGAADDDIINTRLIDLGKRRQDAAQAVRQQIIRTGVAEHAAGGFTDRGALGGDDVAILDGAGHGSNLAMGLGMGPIKGFRVAAGPGSIAQRFAGLQRMQDALLGLWHLRQRNEVLAFQVQKPLLIDQ